MSLLSGSASKQLGLVGHIYSVSTEYPQLLEATGTLPGTYSIKMYLIIPPVVHGPRQQPTLLPSQKKYEKAK